MILSISAAVLLGVFLAFLLRSRSLGAGSCVVAVLFGFYLASTGLAAPINQVTHDLAHSVAQLGH